MQIEIEEVASNIWKNRGYEGFYLIEWKHITRPFHRDSVSLFWDRANQVLKDAKQMVETKK